MIRWVEFSVRNENKRKWCLVNAMELLQCNARGPDVNFEARECLKTICNLWWLKCRGSLTCSACIIFSKFIKMLKALIN